MEIVSHGKVTPAVRRILQSQKTFANHISDYEAHSALATPSSTSQQPALPPLTAPAARPTAGTAASHPTGPGGRLHKKRYSKLGPGATPLRSAVTSSSPTPLKSESSTNDTPMPDAPILSLGSGPGPAPHPGDNDPLLVSRIPEMPSQAEIERLLAAPPLSYSEARGSWTADDRRKPVRQFCEVCGYWGRVRCMRCGGRVCALDCLRVHQEDCFTRYGA